MRIQQAQIALDSERVAYSYSRTELSLQASFTGSDGDEVSIGLSQVTEVEQLEFEAYSRLGRLRTPAGTGPANAQGKPPEHSNSRLLRAPEFRPLVLSAPPPPPAPEPLPGTEPVPGGDGDLMLLKLLIELLSGHEIEVAHVDASPSSTTQPLPDTAPAGQFSIDFSYSAYHYEMEQTSFQASGTVQTADGTEISFDFALEMTRSFESYTAVEFHAGNRRDPLALDGDGAGPQLSSGTYAFDLDGDGSEEQVPLATGGSAFLALDLDGNGRITSGRELFGALSGDGFADLAHYDADRNGFIDEADPVFAQLLAWRLTEDGTDRLDPLAALGVGALYLGSAATPFELRTSGDEALGAVRRSGVYLQEDGRVGALQQLDLVV